MTEDARHPRPRVCASCGKALPEDARSTRKYCDATCRYHKFLASRNRVSIPATLRFHILQRDHFRCRYCGQGPSSDADGRPVLGELFVDHVVSVKDGGALTDERNLVTACSMCNQGKGGRSLDIDAVPPPPASPPPPPPIPTPAG